MYVCFFLMLVFVPKGKKNGKLLGSKFTMRRKSPKRPYFLLPWALDATAVERKKSSKAKTWDSLCYASCLTGVEYLGPPRHSKIVSGKCFEFFREIYFINTIIIKAVIKAEPRFHWCVSGGSGWAATHSMVLPEVLNLLLTSLQAGRLTSIIFSFLASSGSSPSPFSQKVSLQRRSQSGRIIQKNKSK